MWQALALDRVLAAAGLSARTRRLTELMTLNRLVSPAAEHAMPDWIRRTALGNMLATDFTTLADDANMGEPAAVEAQRESTMPPLRLRVVMRSRPGSLAGPQTQKIGEHLGTNQKL